ncbi:MAG: hypothetical protein ACTHNQ_08495 [Microbacterium sp.]|uniref:hypothetical protein n=1 Tax=Microbacterium sp. TaxID=51671 RepID=UPI003F7F51A8
MRAEPHTWFGVITQPGRQLTLTILMGLLIVAVTVLSILFPALGSWLFVATALVAAAWYTHMMRRWNAVRRRS